MVSSDLAQRQHLLPEQYPWKLNTVTQVSHIFPVDVICRCRDGAPQSCLLKWNFQKTADSLQISLPRKRRASYRPARALITRLNARFPKKSKWAWKISLAERFELTIYLTKRNHFFPLRLFTDTGSFDSHNDPWLWAVDTDREAVILHFLAERREECFGGLHLRVRS